MIIIGLGSGRTGTASLSHLIGSQENAICFHELNPTGCVFEDNPQPILNTINEFQAILNAGKKSLLAIDYSRKASLDKYQELQKMNQVNMIGDIAYYYLNYVDDILNINSNVRFICIKRDRSQTVASWMVKSSINRWPSLWLADRLKSIITRSPFHKSKNFWQQHDGTVWQHDPVWDKTFPNFEAGSKEEAIGKYWDYYYEKATRIQEKNPEHFKIFPIEAMSSQEGQVEILSFIGLDKGKMILKDEFHLHKINTK